MAERFKVVHLFIVNRQLMFVFAICEDSGDVRGFKISVCQLTTTMDWRQMEASNCPIFTPCLALGLDPH